MSVQDIISGIITREGSAYTNDPNDAGGPTKYGITLGALREYHKDPYTNAADVQALTIDKAYAIYMVRYVVTPRFDALMSESLPIAEEVIDTGVNLGPPRAAEFLQRSLNALNRQGKDYADVKVDMRSGPTTVSALRAYLDKRGLMNGEKVMLRALNGLQVEFYISLAERRQTDEEFVYGWLLNRVSL